MAAAAAARRVIVTADDFGLSPLVNAAVEAGHRDGILTSASLMVGGEAAADAVRIARTLPGLAVGLHLVLVEGCPTAAPDDIPDLLDADGRFGSDQFRRGLRYADPRLRAQLAREIEAQFAAYAATGLPLDHADAHKHMHLHPVVGRLLIEIGRGYGLRAIRVPAEPASVLRACGEAATPVARVLALWSRLLRRQAARAGLRVNDHVFGLSCTGHVTAGRLRRLVAHLPAGTSEIYLHPATEQDARLKQLMPGYAPQAELAALLDPKVAEELRRHGVGLTTYREL